MKLRQRLLPFLLLPLLSPLAAVADRAADERACCEDCNATKYFPGFINNSSPDQTQFLYLEIRDWDCCLFSDGIFEEMAWLVDGHWIWRANGDCTATVIESTGGDAVVRPVGMTVPLLQAYAEVSGEIISDTQRNSTIEDSGCCNGDGSLIYGVLSGTVPP